MCCQGGYFLPLQTVYEQRSQMADMLACSHPTSQHDPGKSERPVIYVIFGLVLKPPFLRTLPGQEGWCAMASRTSG